MFYDNKVCDGCSEVMLEGDDIVVCPECGTPHHRDCYKEHSACANEEKHGENFEKAGKRQAAVKAAVLLFCCLKVVISRLFSACFLLLLGCCFYRDWLLLFLK